MTAEQEQALAARFAAGEPGAAMELGRLLAPNDEPAADAWFKAAVRVGGLRGMLQVIDYLETVALDDASILGLWRRRAGIAAFPRTDAPQVWVATSTFAPLNERGVAVGDPARQLVVQAGDSAAAAAAVRRAIGTVAASPADVTFSAITEDELGVHVTIESGPPRSTQVHAFVDALITELVAAGVRVAYVRPETAAPWLPTREDPAPTFPEDIERAAARADQDPSGEAAFTVGAWCQEHAYRHYGDVWFKKAAAQSSFDMVLRVVDQYALEHFDWNGERLADWMARSHRLEFSRVDAPGITVNPALFGPIVLDGCAGYGHDTSVQVVSADPETARQALSRAAARFSRVTLDGHEFATNEELDAAEDADDPDWDGLYTPNYVSDVRFDGPHPHLWMDWKDNMAPRMGRTMIHILIDELLAAGIERAILRPRPKPAD